MLEHKPNERARDRRARMSQAKQDFLHRLEETLMTARHNLAKTQQRYKRNFDARVRAKLKDIEPGSYVYREVPVHPEGVNPKLASPAEGPYRVIANKWPTIIIEDRGRAVRVNANRLVKAPMPLEAQSDTTESDSDTAPPQGESDHEAAHPLRESEVQSDMQDGDDRHSAPASDDS